MKSINCKVQKPAFQYKLTDHLGNTMVLFEDINGDGIITTESMNSNDPVEVLQRNFYYAFGLPMQGPWNHAPADPDMPYLYNGKELEGELGLGWMDYGARRYDAAIGRWGGVDPLAHLYYGWSSYNYVLGNPISFVDPDGRSVESTHLDEDGNLLAVYEDGDNSVYMHANGTTKSDVDANRYYGNTTDGGGAFINKGVSVNSTTSGVLVHGDGNYTIPAGETSLEMTEITWAGVGSGIGLTYGSLSIQAPSDYPAALQSEVTTGNGLNIAGLALKMPAEVLAATKGSIVLDESITGRNLEEMFSNTTFVTTRSVSAVFKYSRIDAYESQQNQTRTFHANLFGAGVGTVGYGGAHSEVEFKRK